MRLLPAVLRRPSRVAPTSAVARSAPIRLLSWSAIWRETTEEPVVKPRSRTRKKSVAISMDDLPTAARSKNGETVAALTKWDPIEGTWKALSAPMDGGDDIVQPITRPGSEASSRYEAEVRQALKEKRIPDTTLGREIYENMVRFSGCILLTRVGKFYESYFEAADNVSRLLGTKLTKRDYKVFDETEKNPPKMPFSFTGFPYYVLDKFLKILVNEYGQTVVIVDEYHAEVSTNNNIVRRVGRVVTPGTLIDESWLLGSEARYLLAISIGESPHDLKPDSEGRLPGLPLSLAYTDVSTGEFFTKDTDVKSIEDELARIAPREIVLDRSLQPMWDDLTALSAADEGTVHGLLSLLKVLGVHVAFADPLHPPEISRSPLARPRAPVIPPASLEGVSILLLRHYLEFALRDSMPELFEPQYQPNKEYMHIDAATLAALEIRHAIRPGAYTERTGRQSVSPLSVVGTLLSVIDRTVSAAGHRLLVRTLTQPSTSIQVIDSRLALVQAVLDRADLRTDLQRTIKGLSDVMRLIQKFKSGRGEAFDLADMLDWIKGTAWIRRRIDTALKDERGHSRSAAEDEEGFQRLREVVVSLKDLSKIADIIEDSVDINALRSMGDEEEEDADPMEDGEERQPPLAAEVIKSSVKIIKDDRIPDNGWRRRFVLPSYSLKMRKISEDSADAEHATDVMHAALVKQLGILPEQLRLMDNKQGSYVYVACPLKESKLPESFVKITSNAKRSSKWAYNPWTRLAYDITQIELRRIAEQNKAVRELCKMIGERADEIQHNSEVVDQLDVSMGFAEVASNMGYVRPILNDSTDMEIVNGRHPSVESGLLAATRLFTPNSTHMSAESYLQVITGPNQGGKSTFLRQNAIIAILAQSGSFVPADRCEMGIVDRVFSRVGARDDLFRDRSTFMLEMVETAGILQNATSRSLVIMDEIGRGTTLQAGVSIAYATLDFILQNIKCRTLFATHYHELAQMLGHSPPSVTTPESGSVSIAPRRDGVGFWCTDVNEVDGGFNYSYRIKQGVNYNSHAIKAAELAGMPKSFLQTAQSTLDELRQLAAANMPTTVDIHVPISAGSKPRAKARKARLKTPTTV